MKHIQIHEINDRVNIPSFNVYPGSSQKQDIEILTDGFEDITIQEIAFMPGSATPADGLSFKIGDPEVRFPLQLKKFLPASKVTIPLTVSLASDKQEIIAAELTAKVSLIAKDQAATTGTTIDLNIPLGFFR